MKRVNVVHAGIGMIGTHTIENVRLVRAQWRQQFGVEIVFRMFADTSGAVACDEQDGYSDDTIDRILSGKQDGSPLSDAAPGLGLTLRTPGEAIGISLERGPCVIVDAAAGSGSADISFAAVTNGSGAVFSNKAPLALPAEDQRATALWNEASASGLVRYEATCGAGLPVISSIHSLLDTGDEIIEIVGTLSGTLGAILTNVDAGMAFSEAVRDAAARGYTEPDPRDDLSGLDVARKALILARTVGRDVDLEDIEVEGLVPEHLIQGSVEEFLAGIDALDSNISDQLHNAKIRNSVLKYIARIGHEGAIRVGLEPVSRSTVVGATTGPDNVVEIRTVRYDDYPMSVVGPGAGAAVTAAGVTADVLELARHAGD